MSARNTVPLIGAAVVVVVGVVLVAVRQNQVPAPSAVASPRAATADPSAAVITSPSAPALRRTQGAGVWGAAADLTTAELNDQTVRDVVRLSAGGTGVAVSLSNAYGSDPITFTHVTVARTDAGAGVVAATITPLTFGGSDSVTIPAQGEVVSDTATGFVVPDLAALTVSIYTPNAAGPVTGHVIGNENAYVSSRGDFTADPSSDSFPEVAHGKYFLDGVYLATSDAAVSVAVLGDSITDGVGSSFGADVRWPDDLAQRAVSAGMPIGVMNEGIGSNQLLNDSPPGDGAVSGLHRFMRDVLDRRHLTTAIELIGINDLTGSNATAADLEAGLMRLIIEAHADDICLIGGTVMPYQRLDHSAEEQRQALNTWIRTSGAFDGFVDFDAAVRDPGDPSAIASRYDSGDGLHPNDAGHQALAEAVNLGALTCRR